MIQGRFNEDERSFLNTLKDAKIEDNYIIELIENYESSGNSLKGVCGYFLFNYFAEKVTEAFNRKNNDNFKKADFYLRHEETIKYISKIYGIKEKYLQLDYLHLEAIGSTSFILRSNPSGGSECFAVKILKYRYLDNELIKRETAKYKKKLGDAENDGAIPKIEENDETYVIMNFIQGKTLEEYMKANIFVSGAIDQSKYTESMVIIDNLLIILQRLEHEYNIIHLDLTPSNIMISHDSANNIIIKLIDFGENYVYKDAGLSPGKYLQQQVYLAPELSNTEKTYTYLADIYSVGVIILELLTQKKLEKESMYQVLLSFSLKYAGLSRIITDMIYPEPEDRLKYLLDDTSVNDGNESYELIKNDLKNEINLKLKERNNAFLNFFSNIKIIGIYNLPKIIADFIYTDEHAGSLSSKKQASYFIKFMAITHLLNLIIVKIFFDQLSLYPHNWPGYIVGLSFSIIASSYYSSIFFNIYVGHISKLTEVCIRINSFVFAFPIFYTLIIDPKAWAACSAIGVFIVAVNNYLNYSVGKKIIKTIDNEYSKWPLKEPITGYLNGFQSWGILMFVYSLSLAVLQILFNLQLLKDVWFYSIIVALVINITTIYYFKTVALASVVNFTLTSLYNVMYLEKNLAAFKKQKS